MKIARVTFVALAASIVALAGCHRHTTTTTTSAAPAVMNTKCPFSGNAANPDISSNVAGKKIAFCCNGCKGKFDAMAADKQAEMMAKAK